MSPGRRFGGTGRRGRILCGLRDGLWVWQVQHGQHIRAELALVEDVDHAQGGCGKRPGREEPRDHGEAGSSRPEAVVEGLRRGADDAARPARMLFPGRLPCASKYATSGMAPIISAPKVFCRIDQVNRKKA